jgi:hypothetical protein
MRRLLSALPSPSPVLLGLVGATLAACADRADVTEPGADHASPPLPSAEVPPLLVSRRAALIIRNQGCVLLDGDGNVVAADRISRSSPRARPATPGSRARRGTWECGARRRALRHGSQPALSRAALPGADIGRRAH